MEHLLVQWDAEKNLPLTPDQVSFKSRKKAWWACDNGHCWQSVVYSRTAGCGCPICAGNITSAERRCYERIASEAILRSTSEP